MVIKNKTILIKTGAKSLNDITSRIKDEVRLSKINEGNCTLFIKHTSASLIIQENADPAVQEDLNNWMDRLVPENDPIFTHVQEGPDDMPAHIKSALTLTSVSIPFVDGSLGLGTWQAVYLWEHRAEMPGVRLDRKLLVHVSG